jgi:hypothetical protein
MKLTFAVLLFLIAAIIFGLDFLLGFTTVDYARLRVHSLGWCLVALGLMLWKGGL